MQNGKKWSINNMVKGVIKKTIVAFVLLSTLVSMFSIFSFATSDNAEESGFLGYSGNMTLAELEAETNTSKDGKTMESCTTVCIRKM